MGKRELLSREVIAREVNGRTTAAEVISWFRLLPTRADVRAQTDAEQLGFLRVGLGQLVRVAGVDLGSAKAVLSEVVLEAALRDLAPSGRRARSELHLLFRDVSQWIRSFPEDQERELALMALASARIAIQSDHVEAACYLISALGWREKETVGLMWSALGKTQSPQLMVTTLSSLGLTGEQQTTILEHLRSMSTLPPSDFPVRALRFIQVPAGLEIAMELLDRIGVDKTLDGWSTMQLLASVVDVADARSDDDTLQDEVWRLVRGLCDEYPDLYVPTLFMAGGVAERCNSPAVGGDLLRWALRYSGEDPRDRGQRHRAYLRLGECIRPRQIEGWGSGVADDVASVLQRDACRPETGGGRGMTLEAYLKEAAWEVVLATGTEKAFDWARTAFEGETDPFAAHRISEQIACLALCPLPDSVPLIIRRPLSLGQQDNAAFFEYDAAVRLARSAGTRAALVALLAFETTHGGEVLLSTAEAASEICVHLIEAGEVDIITELAAVALDAGSARHHRLVSIHVLHDLAVRELLTSSHYDPFAKLAADSSLPAHSRELCISAIGTAPVLSKKVEDWLGNLARGSDATLGWPAYDTLLRHGRNSSELRTAFRVQVGLPRGTGAPPSQWGRELQSWPAYLLGRFCRVDAEFVEAVASAVTHAPILDVHQVLRGYGAPHIHPHDSAILDAVMARLRDEMSPYRVESDLIWTLARVGRAKFATHDWGGISREWRSEARVALVQALASVIRTESSGRGAALATLASFMDDPAVGVRRAAMRAMAVLDALLLQAICEEWSGSESVGVRARAAEVLGWLGAEPSAHLELSLLRDEHARVREAVRKSRSDRRDRQWVSSCVDRVRRVRSRNILGNFSHGRCLEALGDDETIYALQEHLNSATLPPNVRYWIERIVKRLRKRWEEEARTWSGSLEVLQSSFALTQGEIELADGTSHSVNGTVWWRTNEATPPLLEWGGSLRSDLAMFLGDIGAHATLKLEGSTERSVLVLSWGGDGTLVIRGQGALPGSLT